MRQKKPPPEDDMEKETARTALLTAERCWRSDRRLVPGVFGDFTYIQAR
jgi:hypothetical protein